jgi:hypothetical protein
MDEQKELENTVLTEQPKKKKIKKRKSHKQVVPRTLKQELKKKPKGMSEEEKVRTEREIRRYVRKIGDYRKGLPDNEKAICARLLRKMGRTEVEWDRTIHVPGMDNPSVADITWNGGRKQN